MTFFNSRTLPAMTVVLGLGLVGLMGLEGLEGLVGLVGLRGPEVRGPSGGLEP